MDVATRYTWFYGMISLASDKIIGALKQFKAGAGALPRRFYSDFGTKLIGDKTLIWILHNKSNIIADPAKRQSSNELVERTWQTVLKMARAYILVLGAQARYPHDQPSTGQTRPQAHNFFRAGP